MFAVDLLNKARLEASIKGSGEGLLPKNKWPSPYAIASGALLPLSLVKYVYDPLKWLALGAVAVGIFPIILKGIAAIRGLRIDINILVLSAGENPLAHNISVNLLVCVSLVICDYVELLFHHLFSSTEFLILLKYLIII